MLKFTVDRALLQFRFPVALEHLAQVDVEGLRQALQVAFPDAESLKTGQPNPQDPLLGMLDRPAVVMYPDQDEPVPPLFAISPAAVAIMPPPGRDLSVALAWTILQAMTQRFVSPKDIAEIEQLALVRDVTTRMRLVAEPTSAETLLESGWPVERIAGESRLLDSTRIRHRGSWQDSSHRFEASLERELVVSPGQSGLVPVVWTTVTAMPGPRGEASEPPAVGAIGFDDRDALGRLIGALDEVHGEHLKPIASEPKPCVFPRSLRANGE